MPGNYALNTTLALWIVTSIACNAPWALLAVRDVFLATSVPTAVIGLLAEAFVDRWKKRRTVVWATASHALIDVPSFVIAFIAIFRLAEVITAPGKSKLHPILRKFLGGISLVFYGLLVLSASIYAVPTRRSCQGTPSPMKPSFSEEMCNELVGEFLDT